MSKKPKPSVEEFLRTEVYSGGPGCKTCKQTQIEEINSALMYFNAQRKSSKTSLPWTTFVNKFLVEKLGYKCDVRAIKHHVVNCLGQEIH